MNKDKKTITDEAEGINFPGPRLAGCTATGEICCGREDTPGL